MSNEANSLHIFDRAAEFVSQAWCPDGPSSQMHIGDLARGTFSRWPSALGALQLWPDSAGQIQALSMFDGSGVCDLVVRPGHAGVKAAMRALEWAESKAVASAVG